MTNRAGRRRRHRRHKSNARLGPYRRVLLGDGGPLTMMGLAVLMEDPFYQRWSSAKYSRPARRRWPADLAEILAMENPLLTEAVFVPVEQEPVTYQPASPLPPFRSRPL